MVDTLKDIYYAEKQLVRALKKMGKAASHQMLTVAFEQHRTETEQQIQQLEQVFQILGQRAQGKKCPAMDGLLDEGNEHMEEYSKGPGLDAALIVGAQKIEHYEMAAYGSLRTFAELLGQTEAQRIFQTILDQEGATDEKLTGLSRTINMEALGSQQEVSESAKQEA
jgi:ferritin-like metal-binding protein YciE